MNPNEQASQAGDVRSVEPSAANGVVVGGKMILVSQNHLLEPFLGLVASAENLASLASGGCDGASEANGVRAMYCSLYRFFAALLPSASDEVVGDLSYSVALLLVGEAIEANQTVIADWPGASGRNCGAARCGNEEEGPRRFDQ